MNKTHGHATRGWSATYTTWVGMRARCQIVTCGKFKHYGGAGITVCERWARFENFLEDMGERPAGKTIDRLDPTKGYYKENCAWKTQTEQNFNQRLRQDNTSGFKGVSWKKQIKRWVARGTKNGIETLLYCGESLEEACAARKAWETRNRVRSK